MMNRDVDYNLVKSNVCYPDAVVSIDIQTMWHVEPTINAIKMPKNNKRQRHKKFPNHTKMPLKCHPIATSYD